MSACNVGCVPAVAIGLVAAVEAVVIAAGEDRAKVSEELLRLASGCVLGQVLWGNELPKIVAAFLDNRVSEIANTFGVTTELNQVG